MKETILIIIFLTVLITFILIHSSEVSFQESFNGEQYLVRNLEDKDKAADTLSQIKSNLKKLSEYITEISNKSSDERGIFIKEYINNINNKFDFIIFRESTDNSKFTSYSINKGEEIVFCLRSKNNDKIHDINELMYVAIHEIAHVGCPEIGHTPLFRRINKELLKYAIECGVYKYKDYNSSPEDYCGIELTNNILNN
jgi:predicted metal-dependent hydrolase